MKIVFIGAVTFSEKTLEKLIAFGKFIQNFGLLKTFLIQYKFKYKKYNGRNYLSIISKIIMKNLYVKRQELKYYVNAIEADRMRGLFSKMLFSDKNTKDNHGYLVSSLYFESYDDRNLEEKLDGILSRRKYRIRIYNKDYSVIKLENKIKENNTISKISSVITKEDSHNLCNLNFKKIIIIKHA